MIVCILSSQTRHSDFQSVGLGVDSVPSPCPSPFASRPGSPTSTRRGSSNIPMELSNAEWSQALRELIKGEGYDIREGMEQRMLELEEQLRSERDRRDQLLEEQKMVSATSSEPLPLPQLGVCGGDMCECACRKPVNCGHVVYVALSATEVFHLKYSCVYHVLCCYGNSYAYTNRLITKHGVTMQ